MPRCRVFAGAQSYRAAEPVDFDVPLLLLFATRAGGNWARVNGGWRSRCMAPLGSDPPRPVGLVESAASRGDSKSLRPPDTELGEYQLAREERLARTLPKRARS